MQRKRFNLPPLDLIQGFEAAARTLSFTKAAEELFITQSAVSRQIRGLEDHLGVALFERRPRSLALTEKGRILHRAATEFLERLQETTDRLRADGGTPHLTVTTTGGFASLWLIPRLRDASRRSTPTSMCASPPATRPSTWSAAWWTWRCATARRRRRPKGAIRLFGEELFPICSPALQTEGPNPLRALADLEHHALLHMDEARDHWTGTRGWPRRGMPA